MEEQFILEPKYGPKEIESWVRQYWDGIDIRKVVADAFSARPKVGYVEGPPTLNGEPHIGHVRGRVLKDLWYRLLSLQGLNVVFRAGWDTQGLPVELQAEKELGLTGSKAENLRAVGEEAIVDACKKLVSKYYEKWYEADRLLGMSMDYERAYWTYADGYIEREWKYLEKAWEKGLLGEGYRVVAYCPSCQTSLSHSEVVQGYETVEDPSLHFKVKLRDEETYLVLWTTMPFTIATDELAGVKPDAEYGFVKIAGEVWIVALGRVTPLMDELGIKEYRVERVVKGKELEGRGYSYPLAEEIPQQSSLERKGRVHTIVAEDFVDVTTGSGIVHLSPCNGEEDFQVAMKRKIPIFNPIDDRACFTKEAGVFEGMFVRDADAKVVELLSEKGLVIKHSTVEHEYPTCWRSRHKLVWLVRREYFYWVDKVVELAVKAAEGVKYYYEPPKNRFLEIIKEAVPWCLSRERVWGTPLPLWVCEKCEKKVPAFNRKEIIEKASKLPDGPDFELHRPWIDKVVLRCPECGGEAHREAYVLDTWHNSGASPYASFTDDEFKAWVPVEFLTEGLDQTRGWAYGLLVENVVLTGKAEAPYKAFLFTGHVLDEKGQKMSKSLGNVIDAMDALRRSSVDVLRFYLAWRNCPIDTLNFSFSEMNSRSYQVISTLYHMHVYLEQNGRYDGYDPSIHTLEWALRDHLLKPQDLWLLSKLQTLISKVTQDFEACRFHEGAREIERFIIEAVSQRYVPFTRSEIWEDSSETLSRRLAIYATLYRALLTIDVLLHPLSPFATEFLYQRCFLQRRRPNASILLEGWPQANPSLLRVDLEEELELISELVSLANGARMKARVKRRWPLKRAVFVLPKEKVVRLEKHKEILQEQANVKEVVLASDLEEAKIGLMMKANYSLLGPRLKESMPEMEKWLLLVNPYEVYHQLQEKGFVAAKIGGKDVKVLKEELEVVYLSDEKTVVMEKGGLIASLDVKRDRDLVAEGIARDLARRLQNLRKERGYNPTDIIEGAYVAGLDDEALELVSPRVQELAFLVRVRKVHLLREAVKGVRWADSEIDGKEIKISVE